VAAAPAGIGLGQLDVGEVDGDEKRLFDQLVVALVGIDPSFGRPDDAVDILIVGGVVEPRSTSRRSFR
jgi:hypothetical protein